MEFKSGENYAPLLGCILLKCWNVLMETMLAKLNNWSKSYKSSTMTTYVEGHEDIVCFRNVVKYIINEKLWSFKKSIEDKDEWVLQAVAKIIREIFEKH